MTPDLVTDPVAAKVFSLCGALALPCRLLPIFVPRRSWTQRLATFAAPLAIAGAYLWMPATAIFAAIFAAIHGGMVRGLCEQAMRGEPVEGWMR